MRVNNMGVVHSHYAFTHHMGHAVRTQCDAHTSHALHWCECMYALHWCVITVIALRCDHM